MSAHTPGPWSACGCGKCGLVWCRAQDVMVATATGDDPGQGVAFSLAEQTANARLIAAAPDLLEALDELKRAWDSTQFRVSNRMEAALDAADRALAKARGGE